MEAGGQAGCCFVGQGGIAGAAVGDGGKECYATDKTLCYLCKMSIVFIVDF